MTGGIELLLALVKGLVAIIPVLEYALVGLILVPLFMVFDGNIHNI